MNKLQVIHPKVKHGSPKPTKVVSKRLRTEAGELVTVYAIDANSPTFGNDFLSVFRENVKKAREENLKLFGSADFVPQKP